MQFKSLVLIAIAFTISTCSALEACFAPLAQSPVWLFAIAVYQFITPKDTRLSYP